MKKTFLLSLTLITMAVGYTTAQEVITTVPAETAIVNTMSACDFTPVTHWSFGIEGGGNYFRVAPGVQTRSDEMHFIVGGKLEYTINPLVGLGLEYMYNPYGHSFQLNSTQRGNLEGRTHDAVLFASINLTNLLIPYRTDFWSKLNIYGNAGAGIGFYQFKLSDANDNVIVDSRDLGDGVPETVMSKFGLNLEYNISRTIALGGEVQYRYYDRANLGGYTMSKGNSDALTATIGLRFKLGATGNKQHARNISMCEYYPKPAPVVIVKDNTVETLKRLDALEAKNDSLNARINRINNRAVVLAKDKAEDIASFPNIEFEFASDRITTDSYSSLDQIAVLLKDNTSTVRLSVAGYTDYIGTEEYNQTLSVKRANAVKTYMLKKGVPASSIDIIGYGEERPIATNESDEGRQKNRRVEFEVTK